MSSNNGCIKFHLNIEDPNVVSSDYFEKYINGKYRNVYQAELIQPSCPSCHSTNLKHNGHCTSNVRITAANASEPTTIKLKKNVFPAMIALKGL